MSCPAQKALPALVMGYTALHAAKLPRRVWPDQQAISRLKELNFSGAVERNKGDAVFISKRIEDMGIGFGYTSKLFTSLCFSRN